MVFTNNTQRGTDGRPAPDKANPRANNAFGHIIEATEDGNDYTATSFRWEVFLLGGDPSDESTYFAGFPKDQVSPIGCPDNICFDSKGNIWIATDGQPAALKVNDAIHAVPTTGPQRGRVMQILSAVAGAEVASLVMNPDDTALFASIQHPGEGGSLEKPTSTWPNGVALPSLVVVTRADGQSIGA
jgi:secreted PhoX family phosphatase